MTDAILYHNPRCGKSRDTLALLQERGIAVQVVEYLKHPPSPAELARILTLLGKPARDITRAKEAAEAGIDPKTLTEAQLIQALHDHPIAIERPILVVGSKAALGRPPENVLTILP